MESGAARARPIRPKRTDRFLALAVKRAIQSDLMEGGAKLIELLDEIDQGKAPLYPEG